jgi:predicted small metal-binding protein
MAKTVFDCSRVPHGKTCSVQIIGSKTDVVKAARDHLESAHGRKGEKNLRENVKSAVEKHGGETTYSSWI